MSYEKTIAREYRIYSITFSGTFQSVYDSLTRQEDKDELFLFVDKQKKITLDGFIVANDAAFDLKTSIDNPASIHVEPEVQFCVPVENWHDKTFIAGSGTGICLIFLS